MRRACVPVVLSGWSVVLGASCAPARAPSTVSTPPSVAPAAAPPTAPRGERVLNYTITLGGRRAGESEIRILPDGKRVEHFTFTDRGRGPDLHSELVLDAAGAPRAYRVTGNDYLKAPVDEQLALDGGVLRWRSTSEHGEAPPDAGWYLPAQNTTENLALLARALLGARDHRLKLLPAGEAWIEDDTVLPVEIAGAKRQLRRIAIAGLGFSPSLVWLDENTEMFASVSLWSSVYRTGSEAVLPALIADDHAWVAARAGRIAARLTHRPPSGKLAITHARLYDSERRKIVPDATVIVDGDRIAAVGGAATAVPAGAQVIDAHGRTLLPGLWDMHVHLSDSAGTLQLASGITTVRDLGNNTDDLTARVARFDAGTEIGPRVLRAGLIDGPGPFQAPTGVVAATAEEATAAVARFADAGYVEIKIYSSLSPSLVPVIARAAHARGLRVSGHVPSGMEAAAAVENGFDEIHHANQVLRRLLLRPEDDPTKLLLLPKIAERAADMDFASPAATQLFDLLLARRTVIDPTLVVLEGMFVTNPGEIEPLLAPYQDRLPATVARSGRAGGLLSPDRSRARFRSSFDAFGRMVKVLWDRKIPLVAGTDTKAGLSLSRELELFVQAGIPAPEVLSIATLGAARVMGQDRQSGSIAVGKRADLVLIDGDPTRDISAVRKVDVVVSRGAVYDPAELFASVGMQGRAR